MAQDHADVDIMTVYLSVTGAHIVGQNNRGHSVSPRTKALFPRSIWTR